MKITSFVNMKGGVGKTTLAVNVAHVLSERLGKRVLIVDVDPQFNATQALLSGDNYLKLRQSGCDTVYDIFSENPAPLVSLVEGTTPVVAKTLETILPTKIKTNLDLMLGNLEIYRVEMVAGQGTEMRLKAFLKHQSANYDYAIIDTPPTPSVYMSSAILASHYYVVPIKPEPMSRVGIDLLQGVINRVSANNGHDISCAGVVITMSAKTTLVYKECRSELRKHELWKDRVLRNHLPQRTAIAKAQGKQELILDGTDFDSKRAITNIVTELLEKIDG